MAYSQAQLDAIEDGIAAGSTEVSYDGKRVVYRSLDDMLRIRGILRRALGLDPTSSQTVLVSHDPGFVYVMGQGSSEP